MTIAADMKENQGKYKDCFGQKTLLMLFEKPSLRTRVSFETGMTQMGGHAIFYSIADSPLGQKESLSDTGKVLSRFGKCHFIVIESMLTFLDQFSGRYYGKSQLERCNSRVS